MQVPSIAWQGSPYPLGATWTGDGVNFAVYSDRASLIQLCLFDENGYEARRINMRWNTNGIRHCFLPQGRPGLRYGFRAHGAYDPKQGLYFNPNKLLLDPYAKSIAGRFRWNDALYSYVKNDSFSKPDTPDSRDSAPFAGKAEVIDGSFDWQGDKCPRTPLKDTIIYEMHVKGFTKLCPQIPEELRGTYAGLAHEASVSYLTRLGVTAVELLPVHYSLSEPRLEKMGLSNYWGYNTIGFFAPDPRFASTSDPVTEFKEMVRTLHKAGIEVILDVVYNHTAEQGSDGPSLMLRGLDNPAYYRLNPGNPGDCLNFTGCGNTLDTRNPMTLRLVLDSLRYWAEDYHIDGFRFDLASALGRQGHDNSFSQESSFFAAVSQDPILSRVKLIAEPWDCGDGGYRVGGFPKGWMEWNADFRDTMRSFWKGDKGLLGRAAGSMSGSSNLYWSRGPLASINFITAHDGFTLRDLVSYEQKRNTANGENNCDGNNNNVCWNSGWEGPTSNNDIIALRKRRIKNMLISLILAQGIPMITSGDEAGRTQQGNNNAYCQDNAISYFNWQSLDQDLLNFTRKLIALRKHNHVFRRTTFFLGEIESRRIKDVVWLSPHSGEMNSADWNSATCAFGMYISGECLEDTDSKGNQLWSDSFLLIFNAENQTTDFYLPRPQKGKKWALELSTDPSLAGNTGYTLSLKPHSSAILREI